jgi:hypothetical protein
MQAGAIHSLAPACLSGQNSIAGLKCFKKAVAKKNSKKKTAKIGDKKTASKKRKDIHDTDGD